MRASHRPASQPAASQLTSAAARRAVRDRVRAWWGEALHGRADSAHPTYGPTISARIDGDTLIVNGTVPREADLRQLADEVRRLKGRGVKRVRNQLRLAPTEIEVRGLYVQTLLAMYATESQAAYAEGYFEGAAIFTSKVVRLLKPGAVAALRASVPSEHWSGGEAALSAGHCILLVTVDETDAFRARELLEEDTRSLLTLALPPEPTSPDTEAATDRDTGTRETGTRASTT